MKNVIIAMRSFAAGVVFFALAALAFGQDVNPDVNRTELEENQAAVNFINYVGPYTRIDTVEQIRAIGYGLGQAVKNGAPEAGTDSRYFVIHSVSPLDGTKLDADIFGLGIDVGVDHIRNLRLIIQGFLEGAYDYSAADAALLSRYVTIYNAVFRGDWNTYTTRYKAPVVQNLTTDKAGLSIRFDEWPGQTLMTIPLGTGAPGSLSAIETGALTSPEVIDQMRRDGGGIEDRQGMVDVKEREAAEASQSAALQREAIKQEDQNIERDRAATEAERQRIDQERQQTQQDQAAGRISQQEADRRQQDLARQQQENDQKQDDIARREEAQEGARQEANAAEARAEQKTEEAQQERQQIAQDQQAQINNQTLASAQTPAAAQPGAAATPAGAANPAAAANVLGVKLLSKSSALGSLVKLDPSSSTVKQSSTLNTINGRTVILAGNRIFAVAGMQSGNKAIRLVELSPDTLEMIKQGADDINQQSLLWSGGQDLYAVVVEGKKNYLARFNTSLEKQARTDNEVHPYATCVLQGTNLLTQKADGSPLILNAQTLK